VRETETVTARQKTGMHAIRLAFDEILMSRHPGQGLENMQQAGTLQVVLPEVADLAGLGDYEGRHKDVWQHTKQVVAQTIPQLHLRWAALLHDIGKARTRRVAPNGGVTFHGHAEKGARMFDRMVRREPWFLGDHKLESQVRFLILHHQRTAFYESSWTDSAVRRFARELAPNLDDIFALARADMTTKRRERKRRNLLAIKELRDRIARLAEQDAVVPPLPKGLGSEIMSAFGLPPSKRIGQLRQALEEAVEQGTVPAHRDCSYYIDFLKENATRFGL